MSLSWNDEQNNAHNSDFSLSNEGEVPNNHGYAPLNKFKYSQSYGIDMKLEAPTVNYAPPTTKQTVVEQSPPKEKKKCWLLRPVAWVAFLIAVALMNSIINIVFLLGAYVVAWLSTLPTMAVVLLTIAFGSFALGLLFTGAISLIGLVVSTSHAIYPSKTGVRFYIIAASQLLISLVSIVLALTSTDFTFLDVASPVYFAFVYIVMLCSVKSIIS